MTASTSHTKAVTRKRVHRPIASRVKDRGNSSNVVPVIHRRWDPSRVPDGAGRKIREEKSDIFGLREMTGRMFSLAQVTPTQLRMRNVQNG